MVTSNFKEDFDKLRGGLTLDAIGKRLGVPRQNIYTLLQRENVIPPQIVRLFDAIGYDITLTYTPKPDADLSPSRKEAKHTFQVRRGNIRLKGNVQNTKYLTVSSAAMMSAVEDEQHDLLDLDVIGEFDNPGQANAFYQNTRKDLASTDAGKHDVADVLVLTRIDPDGTISIVNKWTGKLIRKPKRGPGRPPKEESKLGRISISSAIKMIDKREE